MSKSDWKTKTGGILGAVYGLIGLTGHFLFEPDPSWALSFNVAVPLILGGFAVFGLGAKVQKLIDALKK